MSDSTLTIYSTVVRLAVRKIRFRCQSDYCLQGAAASALIPVICPFCWTLVAREDETPSDHTTTSCPDCLALKNRVCANALLIRVGHTLDPVQRTRVDGTLYVVCARCPEDDPMPPVTHRQSIPGYDQRVGYYL